MNNFLGYYSSKLGRRGIWCFWDDILQRMKYIQWIRWASSRWGLSGGQRRPGRWSGRSRWWWWGWTWRGWWCRLRWPEWGKVYVAERDLHWRMVFGGYDAVGVVALSRQVDVSQLLVNVQASLHLAFQCSLSAGFHRIWLLIFNYLLIYHLSTFILQPTLWPSFLPPSLKNASYF